MDTLVSNCVADFSDARKYVNRHWKNKGCVFLHSDFRERLEITQLNANRLLGQQTGGIHQPLCCRILAFRVDNLGALFALGLSLLGHGA